VALVDSTFDEPLEAFGRALAAEPPSLAAIVEDNFNFLTKMCLTQNRELAARLIALSREAGVAVVVNGSDASDNPQLYLEAGAAAVILGEVERSLAEIAAGSPLDQTPGLALWRGGRLVTTPPRAPSAELDHAPAPAWDLAPLEDYRRAWIDAHGRFSLNLVSSRGCPYRCNWCAKPIFGASYQAHSPRFVAEQMARLKRDYEADHIWFADDIFALSAQWTREFAGEVERLAARLPFKMQSRCGLMTREVVSALARAGCEEVWMGAESGSQKVLDAMDKDLRVEQIGAARENLRRHGIRACYFIQFGYPGELWADIERTAEMIRETQPDDIGVSVSYPLPGTVFYERVAAQLGSKRNWSHSDDLAMMHQGAYSTDFYRALRDALHLEVERGRDGDEVAAAWAKVDAQRFPEPRA
jgi:anaerobic magnesium-protoporphyrin IX monomethyl ester cyclase